MLTLCGSRVGPSSISADILGTSRRSVLFIGFGELDLEPAAVLFELCPPGLMGGVVGGDDADPDPPELDLLLTTTLDQSIGFSSSPMSFSVCPIL